MSPPVLFFFLGMIAALMRSNLRVPEPVTKVLSLYLLWAIGFRGGVELRAHGLHAEALAGLGAAFVLACVVPVYTFFFLRRRVALADAAAIAACYGSISAVTFMAAAAWLEQRGIPYGGHMVAAMVLMESPAIVVGVLLLRLGGTRQDRAGWGSLLHEAFLNGPVVLMLGSLAVGLITGERGYEAFKPLCTDLFPGVLVFFLLDLGLLAAARFGDLRKGGPLLIGFALVAPLVNASLAIGVGHALDLEPGNAVLLTVLAASASYIAAPAALRLVVPSANPSLYLPLVLAVTFPFNIGVGIPLYAWIVRLLN